MSIICCNSDETNDKKIDVWNYGINMFTLIYGKHPSEIDPKRKLFIKKILLPKKFIDLIKNC